MPLTRKALLIVLASLLVVLLIQKGRAPRSTHPTGTVALLAVTGQGLCWVQKPEGQGPATLWRADRLGAKGRQVASAPQIRSLTAANDSLLYLTDGDRPGSGQLWRLSLDGGGPVSIRQGLRSPQGLWADEGGIYWAETRPSPTPGLACVPVLQPLSLIYRADPAGRNARLLAVAENTGQYFAGDLLGEQDGKLYWLQRYGMQYNRAMTRISRVPVGGGTPAEMARLTGTQEGLLGPGALWWTAPSWERDQPMTGRTVYRQRLAGEGPELITDWMEATGSLHLLGRQAYYADGFYLWRLPKHLDEALPVAALKAAADTVVAYRGAFYGYHQDGPDREIVCRRLTLRARLRGLLGRP